MAERALPTEKFREDHRHLTRSLARFRAALGQTAEGGAPLEPVRLEEASEFLHRDLVPHLEWERQVLLPLAREVVDAGPGSPSGEVDYGELMSRLRDLIAELATPAEGGPSEVDPARIAGSSAQLEEILSLHFQKIDQYLDALDQHATREELERLIFSAKEAGIH